MLEGLELRHWDEASGYYLDWDVRSGKRFEALNLDGAYGLGYVTDPQRVRKVVAALHDPQRFGLRFPPTLSSSEPAFDPRGYWRGAYWPREMQHLGRALCQAKHHGFALRLLVQALMSQDGCVIAEHLEPHTGELLGSSVTMAYSGGLNLALREVLDAVPDSQQRIAEVSP
jgi:hypothetical protein